VSGRPQILPALASPSRLNVSNAWANREEQPIRSQDPMNLAKGSVQVMNMFKDMQSNHQVERSVVEPHGLNVALIHA
jgi:hypothetical protein